MFSINILDTTDESKRISSLRNWVYDTNNTLFEHNVDY